MYSRNNYAGNPLGVSGLADRLAFAPYFLFKDLVTIFIFIIVLSVFVFFMPNILGDSENYVIRNLPCYFILFYVILTSIPYTLIGIMAMISLLDNTFTKFLSRSSSLPKYISVSAPKNIRYYTTFCNRSHNNSTHISSIINPWFITGFVDAEGSFIIKITKSLKYREGWKIEAVFSIGLHEKDLSLLKGIQAFWGGIGRISKHEEKVFFTVSSKEHLSVILAHFENYPLITQKRSDYLLFKRAIEIINKEFNKTLDEIQEIVNIKASLNKGLSETLKESFPQTIPVVRPLTENQEIPHPEWIAGFSSGEGCFFVNIRKGSTKIGFRVDLAFILTQHTRDEQLLRSLIAYFGCGNYYQQLNKDLGRFKCENFLNLYEKILPFFQEYKIRGVKVLDFQDWCEIADIIKSKTHLTSEGFARIQQIKAGMNRSRTDN